MARPAALVERFEPVRQDLDVRVGGLVVDVEAEANLGEVQAHDDLRRPGGRNLNQARGVRPEP